MLVFNYFANSFYHGMKILRKLYQFYFVIEKNIYTFANDIQMNNRNKISKKMEEKSTKKIYLPPHGCVTEIAKLTGYSRTTVMKALRKNAKGMKAEKVRQIFRTKYM